MQIVRRVCGAVQGTESRIIAVARHALVESAVGYGLACTGNHVSQQIIDRVDTGVLNIPAKQVVGANISARREAVYAAADINSTSNRLIAKSTNMLDRALRSTDTAAQSSAGLSTQTLYRKKIDKDRTTFLQAWEDVINQNKKGIYEAL